MSGSSFTDHGRSRPRAWKSLVGLTVAAVLGLSGSAAAETLGPINFETGYSPGNINGQSGWTNTGPYDAAVASVSAFPAASGYGFGTQALRISDATTSGSFGDQPFSPGLANEAGETTASIGGPTIGTRQQHFEVTFQIGTTLATEQSGLHMTMSPDHGDGARMSYLRFDDLSNGVHVFFDDVTDPGGIGTPADFNERAIATLSRATSHTIRMTIDFNDGPANDVVQVFVDGALVATGGSWEDYYRFDPEQTPSGNRVPTVDKVLFRESGDAHAGNMNEGYLIDNIGMTSSPTPTTPGGGVAGGVAGATGSSPSAKKCKKHKKHKTAAAAKKCKKHKKHH